MSPNAADKSQKRLVFPAELRSLTASALLRSVVMGVVVWIIALVFGASFVSLIFHGRLEPYIASGLGIFLVSSIALCLFTALFSSDESAIPSPQSTTAIIVASMAANLVALPPSEIPDGSLFLTVVATIVLSSLVCGVFFIMCGAMRIANFVRFLPYPVVGGFIAGMGWLLFQGSFSVMVDLEIRADTLSQIFSGELLQKWLPALAMAVTLLLSLRFSKNMLMFPAVIVCSILLLGGIEHFSGASDDALAPLDQNTSREIETIEVVGLTVDSLSQIDIGLVLSQTGGIAALIVFSTVSLLLNVSGQELIGNRELDFNRELSVAGTGNLAGSLLGGGLVGFTSLAYTTLVVRTGVRGRIVNVVMCCGFLLTLTFGAPFIHVLPQAVLGGILMYLGIDLLVTWLYDAFFKMPKQDYFIVVLILAVIANFGLLWGIAIGLLVSIVFFVAKYSQVAIVKQEFAASRFRSNIDRSYVESRLLNEASDRILVVRLQGFIFFGSIRQFYQHMKLRLADSAHSNLQFIILDFQSVQGIDISAAVDINKLYQHADVHGIRVLLSNISPQIRDILRPSGSAPLDLDPFHIFDDLDHATEWCENKLIEQGDLYDVKQVSIQAIFDNHAMIRRLDIGAVQQYLERVEASVGDYLAYQGEEVDDLFIIESGRVDIDLKLEQGRVLRLRSMTAGTIVGEVGFYLGTKRSASIRVTESGVFHKLTRDALHQMEEDQPQAAIAFHTFISCVLSERLTNTNRMIESLLD